MEHETLTKEQITALVENGKLTAADFEDKDTKEDGKEGKDTTTKEEKTPKTKEKDSKEK